MADGEPPRHDPAAGPAPVWYRFPVEVRVVDRLSEDELVDRVTKRVMAELETALRGRS